MIEYKLPILLKIHVFPKVQKFYDHFFNTYSCLFLS